LKFRFLPGFYKKQSEFNNFPENKLTGAVYFIKFYKIRLFSVFIKLGVSIGHVWHVAGPTVRQMRIFYKSGHLQY